MKNILLFFLFIAQLTYGQTLQMESMFGSNPGNLKMFYYVPESVIGLENVPLLVALHGCSQDAEELAETTGWNKIADSGKFIILYPQQRRINNASVCFNWFLDKDYRGENGESESILQMIEKMKELYSIDNQNITLYGVSAGAAMNVALLANYPCKFKAGVVLAGGPYALPGNAFEGMAMMSNPADRTPEEWAEYLPKSSNCNPKLIVAHGTADPIVDFKNSKELVDQWCGKTNISATPVKIEKHVGEIPSIQRILFGSEDNPNIIFYKYENSGHVILVDPGEGDLKKGGKTGVFARDIDFHSTYFFAKDLGLIE